MATLAARLLLLLLLLCALPGTVGAGMFVVDTTVDDPALTACDDAVPNDCSLHGAIVAANALPDADTVDVPAETYVLTQPAACTFSNKDGSQQATPQVALCLTSPVIVQGAGAATTIIDANGQHRVLIVAFGAVAEVHGVTLKNGVGEIHGGAVNNQGTLRIADSVVSDSRLPAGFGGAVGAGIFNADALTLVRSTVTRNIATSDAGGGIYNNGFQQAVLTVIDSTISNNTIGGSGGGLANSGSGLVTITGSSITGNTAVAFLGGGIDSSGTLTVINSTISDNHSGSSGGGIANEQNGSAELNNVTITSNTSGTAGRGQGGGIANALGKAFVLRNTIVAGNIDLAGTPPKPDCVSSALTSQGHNLIGSTTGCDITGDTASNLTGVDPKLGVLADNGGFTQTHGLIDGSPAIDAGNPAPSGGGGAACAASDQRALLRPLGTACDIGAFERSTAFSLTKILPDSGGNDGSVIVVLSGGGFASGATVVLRRAGHADIAGSPVATESAGASVTTAFDLTGAELGSWDVVVTNPDLASRTLPGGFTVETPRAADLFAIVFSGRNGVRPGQPARFAVIYGNHGNTDALGVPLTLDVPASFARAFSVQVAAPPTQPGQPFDDYTDVPLDVGVDVASEQVDIPLLIPVVPAGFTGILEFMLTAPPGDEGTEFTIRAFVGTSWFANGSVRADVVAEAATRARQMAVDRLGLTAGPEIDPALVAYETAALDLAVASSRAELVDSFGQNRRIFSLAYFAIDLAGYVAAQTVASATPAPLTSFAGLLRGLAASFGLVASPLEAQIVCPPCVCGQPTREGCSCPPTCIEPIDPDKPPKKPPNGLTPAECNEMPRHKVSADGTICKPDGSKDCPRLVGTPFHSDPNCRTYAIKVSLDPNDKAGSGGSGPERFVAPGTPMPYAIAFENLPAATAPAQTVVVTDQLDTEVLDLDSFTLGPILIGGNVGITPPPGLATFSGGADLRPAHDVVVRVDAALDKATGIATWRFTSLDPSTMEALTDPDEGFLPPNTNPPAGDAQVHFSILPKAGIATGTEIRNHARVVFDTNAPIDTPEWLNTVDASAPASQVDGVDGAHCDATALTVRWSGTDTGSGIATYSVFVSENRGAFAPLVSNTTDTSIVFTGTLGSSYGFYSVARDVVGNVENALAAPDLETTLSACCSTNADCDDGNACTGTETCDAATGACIAGAPLICGDDGDPCTTDECVPPSGCDHVRITSCPAACAAECVDDDPCTTDQCNEGRCERGDLTSLAGARCVCQRSPGAACAGQSIPARLTKKTNAVCTSLERAATVTKTKQRKKLLKKAANGWRAAGRLLGKAAIRKALSPGCLDELRDAFDDAATRATRAVIK